MNKKLYTGLALVVVVAAVIVGVIASNSGKSSGPGAGSSNNSKTSTATNAVAIQNYMFSPANITVKVGTTVTWTNKDAVNHTITADTNSTDAPSSMDVADGKTYSFTFKKAGTFTYHCTPHPYMHGTVVVTN